MADVPTPHSERPRYRVVADELRRRILSGVIPPGSVLPSEATLMAEFDVARGTVREAIALVRAEGLAVTEQGRGTYARPVMPVRRVGSDRYRRDLDQVRDGDQPPPTTTFTRDQGIGWSEYRLDREFREIPATTAVAELFGEPTGTMLLERRFTFYAHEVPQQMSVSCYPLDIVAGTPVADPASEPWPGGSIAQLHSLGVTVTGVRERVRTRMPLRDEIDALRIPGGVPVLTLTRQMYAGERVVEVAHDIVIPGDRAELDYYIDLT